MACVIPVGKFILWLMSLNQFFRLVDKNEIEDVCNTYGFFSCVVEQDG